MATAGAVLGLGVPGVRVDDVASTAKTMPEFAAAALWAAAVDASGVNRAGAPRAREYDEYDVRVRPGAARAPAASAGPTTPTPSRRW